mgnify:CR=1 FL=1|jgi:hypothetical protein
MIETSELVEIRGGASKWILIGGAVLTFLVGLIDGYIRPVKCN